MFEHVVVHLGQATGEPPVSRLQSGDPRVLGSGRNPDLGIRAGDGSDLGE